MSFCGLPRVGTQKMKCTRPQANTLGPTLVGMTARGSWFYGIGFRISGLKRVLVASCDHGLRSKIAAWESALRSCGVGLWGGLERTVRPTGPAWPGLRWRAAANQGSCHGLQCPGCLGCGVSWVRRSDRACRNRLGMRSAGQAPMALGRRNCAAWPAVPGAGATAGG